MKILKILIQTFKYSKYLLLFRFKNKKKEYILHNLNI